MTLGRVWWFVQRDIARGFKASLHDYTFRWRLRKWVCPYPSDADGDVSVHTVTGNIFFPMTLCMLTSWFLATRRGCQLFLHDDGTLTEDQMIQSRRLFPGLSIVPKEEGNLRATRFLRDYPHCREMRAHYPPALKFFDPPMFSDRQKLIILDGDLLFFSRPDRILDWIESGTESIFMKDIKSAYLLDDKEATRIVGCPFPQRLNSGICLTPRALFNFEFCETFLTRSALLQKTGWTHEQTLFAAAATYFQKWDLLSDEYELSLNDQMRQGCVCRHYVGAVRRRFFEEGLPQMKPLIEDRL